MTGKLIIFSAPSGSGKSTLINYLMGQDLNLAFSISATSRPPRGTERDGVEYFFLTPEEFRQRIANGEFLEYEEVYKDRFYGTLKAQVEKQLEAATQLEGKTMRLLRNKVTDAEIAEVLARWTGIQRILRRPRFKYVHPTALGGRASPQTGKPGHGYVGSHRRPHRTGGIRTDIRPQIRYDSRKRRPRKGQSRSTGPPESFLAPIKPTAHGRQNHPKELTDQHHTVRLMSDSHHRRSPLAMDRNYHRHGSVSRGASLYHLRMVAPETPSETPFPT